MLSFGVPQRPTKRKASLVGFGFLPPYEPWPLFPKGECLSTLHCGSPWFEWLSFSWFIGFWFLPPYEPWPLFGGWVGRIFGWKSTFSKLFWTCLGSVWALFLASKGLLLGVFWASKVYKWPRKLRLWVKILLIFADLRVIFDNFGLKKVDFSTF